VIVPGVRMGGYGNSGGAGVGVSSSGPKNIREGALVFRAACHARLGKSGVPDPHLSETAVGDLLRGFPIHAPSEIARQ